MPRRHAPARDHLDTPRLILRGTLGATLIAHGIRHARTLTGTAGWFESIGFRNSRFQAQSSAAVEIGSGVALLAGAATPLAASAAVGTMAVAARSAHLHNGYFITAEGWEYVGFVAATAVATASLGSGRVSVDRLLGVEAKGSPAGRAALAAALGLAGAAAHLRVFWSRPTADSGA